MPRAHAGDGERAGDVQLDARLGAHHDRPVRDPRVVHGGHGRPPRREAREHQLPQRQDPARELPARHDGAGGAHRARGLARERDQVFEAGRADRADAGLPAHGHVGRGRLSAHVPALAAAAARPADHRGHHQGLTGAARDQPGAGGPHR